MRGSPPEASFARRKPGPMAAAGAVAAAAAIAVDLLHSPLSFQVPGAWTARGAAGAVPPLHAAAAGPPMQQHGQLVVVCAQGAYHLCAGVQHVVPAGIRRCLQCSCLSQCSARRPARPRRSTRGHSSTLWVRCARRVLVRVCSLALSALLRSALSALPPLVLLLLRCDSVTTSQHATDSRERTQRHPARPPSAG